MSNRLQEIKREHKAREIITSGSVTNAVWFIAWPTIVNSIFQTAYMNINRIFLGAVEGSTDSQAALMSGSIAPMIQFSLGIGLSIGTAALVARFLGAKQYEDAEEATRQSLILAFFSGLLSTLILVITAVPFVRLIGAKGAVIPLAASYMAIMGAFTIPMYVQMNATSALRSAGDTRRPLYAGVVVVLVNVLFDWLLIFGVGPFPALGVTGAAIATGISRIAGMIMILYYLRRSVLRNALAHLRTRVAWFWRIAVIGLPAATQHMLWATATGLYVMILGKLPNTTDIQAALSIAVAIESLSFMPGVAYSVAVGPLVGQNLGANQPKRAEHCAWVATGHAALIMSLVGVLFLVIPRYLALIYTRDAAVVPIIVSYLVINALCQPLFAVGMVLSGALQGAGDVRIPTLIEFLANYVFRLPLAYLLAITLGYGTAGAWIAMSASNAVYGLMVMGWFMTGYWRKVKV